MPPPIRYARTGDVHIAYSVIGDGPFDLVFVPSWASNIELIWDEPNWARTMERLGSFSRLIVFDRRGTGLSDPVIAAQTLEERIEDVHVVMDAADSQRAAVLGITDGGPMSALFAATHPDRVSALVLSGSFARLSWAPDHEIGEHGVSELLSSMKWGTGATFPMLAPSMADDELSLRWWGRYERLSASPGTALSMLDLMARTDVRDVLPVIQVPTLVLHQIGDRLVPVEHGRDLAARIEGAKLVELPGSDHLVHYEHGDAWCDEIEEFLTGSRSGREPDRILATVLFTDICGSTERAAELGDRRWREVLGEHDAIVRRALERHRGREIKAIGDGFLATFDGPARSIRAAADIIEGNDGIGLVVRAGVHTGECEVIGDDVGGLAVHIAARVCSTAEPGQVLVSSTVRDLVVGSGIDFSDRGARVLKGVPDEWRLFALA